MIAKDYASQAEVKWCPGCGDYAILQSVQKALAELKAEPERTVFISGIGCAGRLPYYLNTFGFHTIHGRAPAVATGVQLMRDDLSVWVIVGDGDGLSIGLHHLLHLIRRDLKLNILLINNQVYGLTKGQASPTSVMGQKTKTTLEGVAEHCLNPLSLALSSGASFVARGIDKNPKQLAELLVEADKHSGSSFVEIYQNCNVFNDKAFDNFSEKKQRASETINLRHGEPLVTESKEKVLSLANEATVLDKAESASIHDETHLIKALQLSELYHPDYPVPLGIFYRKEK
jgi:2-oxoglutarate ferredoxin oxidoreductase subunit beta